MSTAEIIQAIKTNQSQLLMKALYKVAFPPILKYFKLKRGSKVDAEDCFQDAIMALIKKVKLNTYDEQYEVKNFLFVLSRNIWYNKLKRESRISTMDIGEMLVEDETKGVELVLIGEEREQAVQLLMKTAGERCRELLHLIVFENKKMKEIVDIMGFSSEEVVKTNHYRCKQKLKEALKNDLGLLAQLKA